MYESLDTQIEAALLLNAPSLDKPGVLVMDMDSTTIEIECIDEIAALAGVGEEVSAVTELAMQGKLDFAQSLHQRVATLAESPESILSDVAKNIPLMAGLKPLIVELKKGRASDSVVGQLQRYMGYVRDELAEENQTVKGIIIALEDDTRIQRALAVTNNIEFYKYQVSFKLYKS